MEIKGKRQPALGPSVLGRGSFGPPSQSYLLGGAGPKVVVELDNVWAKILEGDQTIQYILDRELRYPTPTAIAIARGFQPPEPSGWDGWIRLIRKPKTKNPYFPAGLIAKVHRLCGKYGYCMVVLDKRTRPEPGYPDIGAGTIPLRDYQEEAVFRAVDAGRGVIVCPPRSGKTRISIEIHRRLSLPTIWIAPTDRIVTQTHAAITDFYGENYSYHLVGGKNEREAMTKHMVVCTAATAGNLSTEFYKSREIIVVDEWHHCLSGVTRVLTVTGGCAIQDVTLGTMVWSEGPKGLGWNRVTRVWKYSKPPIMRRLTTKSGKVLEVTDGHRIYTPQGKVFADMVREGGSVHVLEMWKGNYASGTVRTARRSMFRSLSAPSRDSNLRYLRARGAQAKFWGTSCFLFGAQSLRKSRSTRTSYGQTITKYRIPKISLRAYAGGSKSYQTTRSARQDFRGLGRYGSSALWKYGKMGQGEGQDRIRKKGGRSVGALGVRFRVSGFNWESKRARGGNMVQFRFCAPGSKDSRRNRRQQPSQSEGGRREEGPMLYPRRLGSFSYSRQTRGGRTRVVADEITEIRLVSGTGSEVYDLEVEFAHNYFAEGVKVSNSSAKTYRNIMKLCPHIYHRYGMTGTHFRSHGDDLEMHGLLSNVVYKIGSGELLKRGHLVSTRVVFLPVPAKPRLYGLEPTFQSGHGKYGIHEHQVRNLMAATAAVHLYRQGRKVLVLVGTKRQGRILQALISDDLPRTQTQYGPVEFVSTDVARKKQAKILKAYLESDEVQVLIGTTLLGEGVDLPVTDALVYARGEQAQVSLTQAAYRVCTAVPGKPNAVIVDFADRHNSKLRAHSHERLGIYYREPTFTVDVLQDPAEFGRWLQAV